MYPNSSRKSGLLLSNVEVPIPGWLYTTSSKHNKFDEIKLKKKIGEIVIEVSNIGFLGQSPGQKKAKSEGRRSKSAEPTLELVESGPALYYQVAAPRSVESPGPNPTDKWDKSSKLRPTWLKSRKQSTVQIFSLLPSA